MRLLTSAAVIALVLSSPALAGERRGGHRPPPGHCGAACRPPVNANVNVHVNASASAAASARSYIQARAYSSGLSRRGTGGGTFIIGGGGYGGDYGWIGHGGGYVHVDDRDLRPAGPSAPFGYVVTGFGRDIRAGGSTRRLDRYGHEGRWRDPQWGAEDAGHYERWETSAEYREQVEAAWEYEIIGRESRAYDRGYDDGRIDGRADCDCRHDAPPPYHAPAPYHEPAPYSQPAPGQAYFGDLPPPDAPPLQAPPRHNYRQEPGERG